MKLDATINDLAFSPAGDLAVASGPDCWLVSGDTAVRMTAARGGANDVVSSVAFRDARTLAIGCTYGGLSIVTLGGTPQITRIEVECQFHMMRWSPDGKYIAGGQYEPFVTVIDIEARKELRVLDPDEFDDESRTALVFAGDALMSTAHNKLVRWRWPDVIAGKARCRTKSGIKEFAHFLDVVQKPDGSFLVLAEVEGHETYLLAFSPAGERVGRKLDLGEGHWSRIAISGDDIVITGDHTRILGGAVLDETLDGVMHIAVHGDRIAIANEHGYHIIQR